MSKNQKMQSFVKELSARNGTRSHSVLDLPIERQEEFAKQEGLSLDKWIAETKKRFTATDEHLAKLEFITFESQEEAEKAGYNLDKWRQPIVPFPA